MVQEMRLPEMGAAGPSWVVEWKVRVGDRVTVDQPLLTIENDKVVADIPSKFAGVVIEIKFLEGQTMPYGAVMVTIDDLAVADPVEA